jgi:hypothetical protein
VRSTTGALALFVLFLLLDLLPLFGFSAPFPDPASGPDTPDPVKEFELSTTWESDTPESRDCKVAPDDCYD